MARSDLLLSLVRSATQGDRALFRKSVEAIIAEERSRQHNVLADNLSKCLGEQNGHSVARNGSSASDVLLEVSPQRSLDDLVLNAETRTACDELVEEQHRADLLRSHNLEPRNRILLIGPPGNGKTSIAESLATALMVPLFCVRYESLIGSYLGETASRLRRVFDYVRTRQCVLFFDEFDTLGKERGDTHETGEIKRVVSSLLLQIDDLPSHVVTVAATNHGELLDRAVWRRFQVRLHLSPPGPDEIRNWFDRFIERTGMKLGHSPETLRKRLGRLSYAELEEFTADILRRSVLAGPDAKLRRIVSERLKQWDLRKKAGTPTNNTGSEA